MTMRTVEIKHNGHNVKAMSIDGQTWSAFAYRGHDHETWRSDDDLLATMDSSAKFQTTCRLAAGE